MRLYHRSLDGYGAVREWPDGRALLDQPVKLVEAFDVIADQKEIFRKGRGG